MSRADRLTQLVDQIVDSGSMSVEQVMEVHGVSAATARRDLDALADQQLITRTRGGARANVATGEVPMRYRAARHGREKLAIARKVVELLGPDQVVAFNGGTTTTTVAQELGVRMAEEHPHEEGVMTVVTNAVNIANDLIVRPQMRVMLTGGVARTRSYELIGPLAEAVLPRINIDTLVLGVTGLDPTTGLFTDHDGEASVNAALVRHARTVIVAADASKFRATAFARICTLADVQVLVTDPGVPAEARAAVEAAGVEVVLAGAASMDS